MEWLPIFWLFVVLKIPLAAALWIVWWALRAEPEPAEGGPPEGGGPGPHRPRPQRPRPSRRGPHAGQPPPSPRRVRARAKLPARTHG